MELVGRRSERNALERAFERAVAGRRTVALIRGDPGIGKTALVSDCRRISIDRGATVIQSSVTETESSIGWSGLATLLSGVDRELIGAARGANLDIVDAIVRPAAGEPVDPLTVGSVLSDVLRSISSSQPLVVVLDDLHWFDHATAAALSFATRLLADLPILIVATARRVPLPIDFERIVDADDLVLIEPTALSLGATRELLEVTFSVQVSHVELVRLHELSAGNPLHVTETGRLIRSGVPVAEALRPASLGALIDMTLDRLEPPDHEVLAAGALMPTARLALMYVLFAADAVDAALIAGERLALLRLDPEDDDAIVFRHPLIRSGFVARLALVAQRQLHRRCADLDVPIEVRAFHLGASATGIDAEAAEVLDAAAYSTYRKGLLTEALAHAERSLALTDPADVVATRRRTLRAADLAVSAGEPARALVLIDPLVAEVSASELPPADFPMVLTVAGRAHSGVDGATSALPWFERAVALLPEGSPERAKQLGRIVTSTLYVDVEQARERALEFVAVAAGDRAQEQLARAVLDVTLALGGLPVPERSGLDDRALELDVLTDWLQVAVWTDDYGRAEELVTESWRLLNDRRSVTDEHNVVMQMSDLRRRQGHLDDAAVLAERAWALADAVDGGSGRSSELAVIAAARGDVGTAHRHAGLLVSALTGQLPVTTAQARFAIGTVAAFDGDHRSAAEHFSTAVALLDSSGIRDLGALPVRPALLDALIQSGDMGEAERVAAEIVALAERAGRPRGFAEALRARARIAAGRQHLDEAAGLAGEAASAFERIGMPVERAHTLIVAAGIARRARRRTEARELLDEARFEMERCGALGYLPGVRAEQERLGDRAEVNALTKTERKIADLVAEGLTNAEVAALLYVSARTVEAHLTKIYRKEGVRGRAELASRHRT